MDKVERIKLAAVKMAVQVPSTAGNYLKSMGLMAGTGVALAATAAGINQAADMWSRRGKHQAYKDMLDEDADLKRMAKTDNGRIKKHFETLFRFNPEMAKDPLVSSSFVKGTTQHDYLAHKTVGELVTTRKAMRDINRGDMPKFPVVGVDL